MEEKIIKPEDLTFRFQSLLRDYHLALEMSESAKHSDTPHVNLCDTEIMKGQSANSAEYHYNNVNERLEKLNAYFEDTIKQVKEETYKEAYKQGRFDAEMDLLNQTKP